MPKKKESGAQGRKRRSEAAVEVQAAKRTFHDWLTGTSSKRTTERQEHAEHGPEETEVSERPEETEESERPEVTEQGPEETSA